MKILASSECVQHHSVLCEYGADPQFNLAIVGNDQFVVFGRNETTPQFATVDILQIWSGAREPAGIAPERLELRVDPAIGLDVF